MPSASVSPFTVLVVSKEYHQSFISRNKNADTDTQDGVYIKKTVNGIEKTYYYTCKKNHESDNDNKPLSGKTKASPGENWYDFWDELSNADSRRGKSKLWEKNKNYKSSPFIYRPLNGYIWYAVSSPLSSLTVGGDNNVGTLQIGAINGVKKVKTIRELERETGFKLQYYDENTTIDTKTQVENKANDGETNLEWQLFCKSV